MCLSVCFIFLVFIVVCNLFQFTDNTFKNYYYPEPQTNDDEVSDEEGTVGYKLKQVIARKRAGNSIDGFFERPIKKAKSAKKSSSVSRSTDDGVSYISSGQDDGAYSSHVIKIEIFDVQKIKNIAPADHWKHADVRLKFYTNSEEDKQLQSTRDVIFNITKQLAEKDTSVKYFIENKK